MINMLSTSRYRISFDILRRLVLSLNLLLQYSLIDCVCAFVYFITCLCVSFSSISARYICLHVHRLAATFCRFSLHFCSGHS